MDEAVKLEQCPGCGAWSPRIEGPTHRYMTSSPACWERFGAVLAREYGDPRFMPMHRLTVDTYAVQHPGDGSRQAIQSVGLHLGRMMLQLESGLPPALANAAMLELGECKSSLPALTPPATFSQTVFDLPLEGPPEAHAAAIAEWARATWADWAHQHDFIRRWVADCREKGTGPGGSRGTGS